MKRSCFAILLTLALATNSFAQSSVVDDVDSWWNDDADPVVAEVDGTNNSISLDIPPAPAVGTQTLDNIDQGAAPNEFANQARPAQKFTSQGSSNSGQVTNGPESIVATPEPGLVRDLPQKSTVPSQLTSFPTQHSSYFPASQGSLARSGTLRMLECGEGHGHAAWSGYAAERALDEARNFKHVYGGPACCGRGCHSCNQGHVCTGVNCNHAHANCGKPIVNRYRQGHHCGHAGCHARGGCHSQGGCTAQPCDSCQSSIPVIPHAAHAPAHCDSCQTVPANVERLSDVPHVQYTAGQNATQSLLNRNDKVATLPNMQVVPR